MAVALAAAACGGSSGVDSSTSTPPPSTTTPATSGSISGVYLRHDSAHPQGGSPAAGVRVGLFLRPITFAGPVMLNPPKPIRVVRTEQGGVFAFAGLDDRRYFVAAIDNHAYAIGRWARPGDQVTLRGCTDCARPM